MIKIATAFKKIGKDKRGFTLVELMAVLAVLAIIAAIAVPRFTGTINTAKKNADKATATIVARAAEQKWLDDQESSEKTYTGNSLANAGYLKEKPEVQADSSYDDYKATVDSKGNCTKVVYTDGTNDATDNLLD
ncbi:prepilin-type N-terminal cleavage/methylation domain-containing protein [Biomaibacter acetigenes]|uniref:Prepilin-type N-terminal cleavage/methylation domain-containing protein n=1 Tax=Biomaibacter acetigenes TaxID=2316383 RepID=A0A3G2R5T9_9FIRM|nr:prepilin-type N-terminal cleavage/methylation domain-containing protein [Biomaibacter acetigenes]AYO30725.1 prepilin-type N-terminal cleavage/methylation domain-containing protein [Biomaibacter acetigenes]